VIPLALPPLPVDVTAFKSFVQSHCEQCAFSGNAIRYVLFHARKPVIGGRLVTHSCDPRYGDLPGDARFRWDPVFRSRFLPFTKWCEALPFKQMYGLELVTQTAHIGEHLDIFGHNSSRTHYRRFHSVEPMYYRLVFCEPDDAVSRTRSFFVTRSYRGKRHYVRLPKGTNAFAMSSSVCYHGATFNPGHFKTTGVIYGELDSDRHKALLEESLGKFSDRAIPFPGATAVKGPGSKLPYRAS